MTAIDAALADLADLYAELEQTIRSAAPVCELSGVCCDFERADHTLFATDLEVEHARRSTADPLPDAPAHTCPYHQGGRCHLRAGRPLGCRVYFCDPSFARRMPEIAEEYHRRLVAIHERHGLTYRYRPFIQSIRVADDGLAERP